MKKTLAVALLGLITNLCFSQIDSIKILNTALERAIFMTESFQNKDYDQYIQCLDPDIVKLNGGFYQMKAMLNEGFGEDMELISVELSMPSELFMDDKLYRCVFTHRQTISLNGHRLHTIGSLFGISYDCGGSWFFLGMH